MSDSKDDQQPLDIIIASRKLQQLFIQRCEELSLTPEKVAKHCGVTSKQIDTWINSLDSDDAVGKISQAEVIRLCSCVFVEVNMTLVVRPKELLTEAQDDVLNGIRK